MVESNYQSADVGPIESKSIVILTVDQFKTLKIHNLPDEQRKKILDAGVLNANDPNSRVLLERTDKKGKITVKRLHFGTSRVDPFGGELFVEVNASMPLSSNSLTKYSPPENHSLLPFDPDKEIQAGKEVDRFIKDIDQKGMRNPFKAILSESLFDTSHANPSGEGEEAPAQFPFDPPPKTPAVNPPGNPKSRKR